MNNYVSIRQAAMIIGSLLVLAAGSAWADKTPQLPPIPNLEGKVLTVTGPVDPNSLVGQALMHEHIFVHFNPTHPGPPRTMTPAEQRAYNQPLTLANLYQARYGAGVRGHETIGDFKLVYNEVLQFKKWGGQTIVDVSSRGLGRDPQALAHMSRLSGMTIIMGSGWYRKGYLPADFSERSVDELTAMIVRDIVKGVDGTGIRSGIIGEVGINGDPLIPNEIKSVRASARASRLTGAPVTFHYGGMGDEKYRVLKVMASEGADLSHVIMGHSGNISGDMPLMLGLLKLGVYIQMDWLGVMGSPLAYPSSRFKAEGIVKLVKAGYADRILLGHDICTPTQLKAYGGTGYSFISKYFLPELRRLGVSEEAIHKIMVENPRRVLTFTAPKPVLDSVDSQL